MPHFWTSGSAAGSVAAGEALAPDQRGGTPDLDDADVVAGLVDLGAVERAGAPHLTIDLDHAVVGVDLLEHERFRALDGLHAEGRAAARVVLLPVPRDHRPDHGDGQGGDEGEDD